MSIRNDIHTDNGLSIYAQGMSNSAPDKARIVDHLQPGSVLEIGCGNGVVLKLAADAMNPDGSQPWVGVDMNAKLLGMAAHDLAGWPIVLQRADLRLRTSFDAVMREFGGFDNVIFSSTLHEIYSEEYMANLQKRRVRINDPEPQSNASDLAWHAAMRALEIAQGLLRPGGRIVVRDGIRPSAEMLNVKFLTDFGATQFYRFVDDYPRFISYRGGSQRPDSVHVSAVDLFEFMTKYFYLENWEVEVNEVFGWTSEEQFKEKFQPRTWSNPGLELKHFESYTIPWLRDKWAGDFEVRTANDEPYCFPSTFIAVLGAQ